MKLALQNLRHRRTQDWLLLDYNGFRCRGTWATISGDELTIKAVKEATEANVDNSLNSLLEQFGSEHQPLPSQALLITSQAVATILHLPINPEVSSQKEQLQALVQWEFEQVLSEQTSSLTLETILAGRGCLSEAEIDDVRLAIGEQKATASCISIPPKKFAEQAIKMGYVTSSDIEEGLALLEKFHAPEDQPVCQFFPLESETPPVGDEGFPWLVCGIGKDNQTKWINRLAAHGIRLERIYPLGYASAAAFDSTAPGTTTGQIALLEGADCYASYRNHQLQSLRWGPAPLSPRNPEALKSLLADDTLEALMVSGPRRIVENVTSIVDRTTRFPTSAVPQNFPSTIETGRQETAKVAESIGALRHQTKASPIQTPWVDGAPPPPPWWQESSRWWGIMGILITLMILCTEIGLAFRRHSVSLATREIESQMESAQGEIAKVQQEASTADELTNQRNQLRRSLQVATRANHLIATGLDLRQKYIVEVFANLASSVTPTIAIDEIEESRNHTLTIQGWAITERDAQEFIHTLTAKLTPWGLALSHQEVQVQTGRLGLTGYNFTAQLAPNTTLNRS